MSMLKATLGESCTFGPTCSSGPLGGDAQVAAQLCLEDLGAVIFFTDPLTGDPRDRTAAYARSSTLSRL